MWYCLDGLGWWGIARCILIGLGIVALRGWGILKFTARDGRSSSAGPRQGVHRPVQLGQVDYML